VSGFGQERSFSSPIGDTERLAEMVTSETAKMKTLETAKAEKVRQGERFPSGGYVRSRLGMAD